jgi:hypothetical protein
MTKLSFVCHIANEAFFLLASKSQQFLPSVISNNSPAASSLLHLATLYRAAADS